MAGQQAPLGAPGQTPEDWAAFAAHVEEGIHALRQEIAAQRSGPDWAAEPCGEKEFVLLMGAISALRRVPGIDQHPGFERLYHCKTEQECAQVREHLNRLFGITDLESLVELGNELFGVGNEYEQFMSFWQGEPIFDERELNEGGKLAFGSCKRFAEIFRPVVGDGGFHAWDYNERIGLLRSACACGMIEEEQFWALALEMAQCARLLYSDWEQYGLSCLCGSAYFMFHESQLALDEAQAFFDLNCRLVRNLFTENPVWARRAFGF